MLICPKCGSIAEYSSYYDKAICTNLCCNWFGDVDEIQNDSTQSEKAKVFEKGKSKVSFKPILRWYYVEYIDEAPKLLQARSVYDLIKELLTNEGEFTPFVEKCYCSFLKSPILELIQFYSRFSEYSISKISEFEDLNVVYDRRK